jgi:predicted RNase H-like nuclease (RuvC/YqgF family)
MTPEAQSKAARQRNELRDQAETIARLRREKMELLRDLKAAKAENARLRGILVNAVTGRLHPVEWMALARAALGETSDDRP